MGWLIGLTMARIRLLGLWLCRFETGLLVWAPDGHSGRGAFVGEE